MGELSQTNMQKGQTLLEVLVALGTAVVLVSVVTVSVISALNNSQFGKDQNQATAYAQQAMEDMRQLRDSNWPVFSAYQTNAYCLDKNSTTLVDRDQSVLGCSHASGPGANVDNVFAREVDIQKQSPDCNNAETKITVLVSWSDGKCPVGNTYCHGVKLVSCLSDFKTAPTP